jgi:restriction system protein
VGGNHISAQARKKSGKGPQFLRFVAPIIDILRSLGGSGSPREVTDAVVAALHIPEDQQRITLKNGTSRITNQVHWARFYLARDGYLRSSERGVWALTEKGVAAKLGAWDVYELFNRVHDSLPKSVSKASDAEQSDSNADDEPLGKSAADDYRTQLMEQLVSLPATAFEMICQRLLREAGFEEVVVTGRSGDGGIDGHGVLKVNPFVTFKVLFQCKRYKGSVAPSQIRDFRGAMAGRTDKGIIITTGIFTSEAAKEARREGAVAIELVDGEKLLDMCETLQLGLRPKRTYEIDEDFFRQFRNAEEKI